MTAGDSDSIIETERMLQEDLNLIINWMNVNCLSLNASKSETMLFTRNYREQDDKLNMFKTTSTWVSIWTQN